MIGKNFQQSKNRRECHEIHHQNPTTNIHKDEKLSKTQMCTLPTSIEHHIQSPSQAYIKEKK